MGMHEPNKSTQDLGRMLIRASTVSAGGCNGSPNIRIRSQRSRSVSISSFCPPPAGRYGVSSGSGKLIKYLASHGCNCVATEITTKRGARDDQDGIVWHSTDGVHLDQFEKPGTYDVVLSAQVVEHIHPDDFLTHLRSARVIARAGGKYILATPHCLFGPADLSAVFDKTQPMCMHLKEYTYHETVNAFRNAGYVDLKGIYLMPGRCERSSRSFGKSRLYLRYIIGIERAADLVQRKFGIRIPQIPSATVPAQS